MQKVKKIINAFVRSYFKSCWLPVAILLIIPAFTFFTGTADFWGTRLILIIMFLAFLGIISVSLWNLFKKRWKTGIINLCIIPFAGIFWLLFLSFIVLINVLAVPEVVYAKKRSSKPLPSYGWQLFSANKARVMKNLELAKMHGVSEIRLSHGIIVNIDTINNNPDRAALINGICDFCDKNNMQTYVWAKELNIGKAKVTQDLNPNGGGKAMWAKRQAAYENAFITCPKLDGVVLQFGSCPTEIWYMLPISWYNLTTMPSGQLELTINQVQKVCKKYGKKIDIRTFNHSPLEQGFMYNALQKVRGYRAMVKEVPQDWQPYYPFNYLIGNCGDNKCTVEFDLSAEYWGHNRIPFVMTDYLSWRMKEYSKRGISGVVVRIERGGVNVLDSINAVNIYSMTRLVKDADTDPDVILDDWIKQEYNIIKDTPENKSLKKAYRYSFIASCKMFYVLNQWALEKRSSIPESVRSKCLIGKNSPQWDGDYTREWLSLCNPNKEILNRIWQEKTEAVELAEKALAELVKVKEALPDKEYHKLKQGYEKLVYYTKIWRCVADAVFRVKANINDEISQAILAGDFEELQRLKKETGGNFPLARGKQIDAFCNDLKKYLKDQKKTARPDINILSNIKISATKDGKAVTWQSKKPGTSLVEWGTKRPIYDHVVNEQYHGENDHSVILKNLQPGTSYFFRVKTGRNVSGDYILNM
jgi:purple acid phosphatase-like protein